MSELPAQAEAVVNHLGSIESMMEETADTGNVNQQVLESYLDAINARLGLLVLVSAAQLRSPETLDQLTEFMSGHNKHIKTALEARAAMLQPPRG